MFTVKQVAEQCGVSTALVCQWVEDRQLACFRLGGLGGSGRRGKIMIAAAELSLFIAIPTH